MYTLETNDDLEKSIQDLEQTIAANKQKLASLRRRLPGVEVQDFQFETHSGSISLSQLFGDKNELIVVSNMGKSCRYCTLWGDNFNGIAYPLADRAGFAVASPDSVEDQQAFAESRGWKFRMVSHAHNSWGKDEGFAIEGRGFGPGVVTYSKESDGKIYRHARAGFSPGDNFCNMWDFVDMLPIGVGDWMPKYEY
jgi:predicted dithiol-disulfide oxidoreductase (DUF899 family)